MIRKRYIGLGLLLAALCAACTGNSSALKSGYYTAEAAEFDEYGWKEYVTICVSGGRITLVEYNAINLSGFVKSWDMDYMRQMKGLDGTYPNAYTRNYRQQLLSLQSTDGLDCLAGASKSYAAFLRLADAAIENARQGKNETRLVSVAGEYPQEPAR